MKIAHKLLLLFIIPMFYSGAMANCVDLKHTINSEKQMLRQQLGNYHPFKSQTEGEYQSVENIESELILKNNKIKLLNEYYDIKCSETIIKPSPYSVCSSESFILKPIQDRISVLNKKLELSNEEIQELKVLLSEKKDHLKDSNKVNKLLKILNVPPFVLSVGKSLGLNKYKMMQKVPDTPLKYTALLLTGALVVSSIENIYSKKDYYSNKVYYNEAESFKSKIYAEVNFLEYWLDSFASEFQNTCVTEVSS